MKNYEKINKIIYIATGIFLVITVWLMYITHRAIPFMMDDLWYSTKLSSEEPIRNLRDIFESQIWHYNNWGGRSITHSILQITLLLGERTADIINVIAAFVLGAVISAVADIKNKDRIIGIWAAIAMFTGLNANWKMSMFWQAGAANYLYITSFIILYIFCFLREVGENTVKPLPGITVWIIPLGLVAGWSNENMGPTAFILGIIVIGYLIRQKRKITLWMWFGCTTSLAGSVAMILAPGNFVRSAELPENQYGALWRLFLRCYAEGKAFCEYLFPTIIITVFILFITKSVLKLEIGKKNVILLFSAFISWGAMILSPHYPDRATFGTMILLICVILSCVGKIAENRNDLKLPLFVGISIVWLRGMYFLGEFMGIVWGWIR